MRLEGFLPKAFRFNHNKILAGSDGPSNPSPDFAFSSTCSFLKMGETRKYIRFGVFGFRMLPALHLRRGANECLHAYLALQSTLCASETKPKLINSQPRNSLWMHNQSINHHHNHSSKTFWITKQTSWHQEDISKKYFTKQQCGLWVFRSEKITNIMFDR